MDEPRSDVWLVRHGETEWAAAGRHTGRTDIPLTRAGRNQARTVGRQLRGEPFAQVLTSPLARAAETARLAGFSVAEPLDDLMEWDYGAYEGRTTAEIREERPGWTIWTDGVPGGETVDHIGVRVDRVIARVRLADGPSLLFAHGHVLRILAARWLALPPADGRLFLLGTATISVLGWEREAPVIARWNVGQHPTQTRR